MSHRCQRGYFLLLRWIQLESRRLFQDHIDLAIVCQNLRRRAGAPAGVNTILRYLFLRLPAQRQLDILVTVLCASQ